MTELDLTALAEDLGRRLQEARILANLTQRELAAQLGCSVRSLQDYEAGIALPRPGMRRKIDSLLKCLERAA